MADVQNNDSGVNTLLIVFILLILVALVVWFFGGFNSLTSQEDTSNIRLDVELPSTTGSTTANSVPTPAPNPDVAPAPRAVNILDLTYSPATLTVKRGTRVTWTNNDTADHNVVSISGNVLNSPTLSTGESFSYTFQNTGTFAYKCTFHPNMLGSVIVTD